ncbi:autotransporter-associated beta strand repeat-containing protein [Dactylosporangium sp. McL0621]|uniref:autotransporter-associated beta strand repeat-containing protein n=1 Tax=Dactylosporangium sp. McL0621 TaxID=3415678 RepID=UPI003CF9274B
MVVTGTLPAPPAHASYLAGMDVTADVRANRNVGLSGDAVVRLAGGVTTYTGVISGEGTFTVTGTGTLVLTRDSDFTLPKSRQRQRVVTVGGNHPVSVVEDPDPPAVIVEKGATLQYGAGGTATGAIVHGLPAPGVTFNALNHRVDGTLDVAVQRRIHLGVMSGSGLIMQRRLTWPGIDLGGNHPFSGVLYIGTGVDFGSNQFLTSMPNVKKIVNLGSAIHSAPDGATVTDSADVYSQVYGNDINFHTWGSGVVRMTGVYSWSDNGSDTDPRLSSPSLNFAAVAHRDNKRGINIEGATVEWGNGTNNRFFLPGNEDTVYINMHFDGRDRSRLTFNYNGPVTLDAPISGGKYHDTMNDVGRGDVVIAATPGNAVTFSAPQNYDGSTTIGKGASLRLGDGTAGGDSALLLTDRYQIVDDGTLILQNTKQGLTLSKISGGGSLKQAGAATTTLTGQTTYQGSTTVVAGTLAVTGGSIATSSGVDLSGSGARLDLTRAGTQKINNLAGTTGSSVAITGDLTVNAGTATTFGGAITGTGATTVTKTGPETLTLTGVSTITGAWIVGGGTLRLGADTASIRATGLVVQDKATLDATGTIEAPVTNAGTVSARQLTVRGDYIQQPSGSLVADKLTVSGNVTLAGALRLAPDQTKTVIDNTGTGPVKGAFDGLPEGATINGYTISYTGGDGNDVVLSGDHIGEGAADHSAGPGLASIMTGKGSALGWSIAAIAVLVLAALLVLVWRRRARSHTG